MKIFLSYAQEDRTEALSIRQQLSAQGVSEHDIYDWMDTATSTSQYIVDDIEQNILDCDAFFIVLSQNYLSSRWCIKEKSLAFHIETSRGENSPGFIHVLKVSNSTPGDLGFLADIRQVDLTGVDSEQVLKNYVERLADRLRGHPQLTGRQLPQAIVPRFRNRDDELQTIRNDLTDSGGRHFWVAVAPPQLGKSWFLERLTETMPLDWSTSLYNLGGGTEDTRRSARAIASKMFGVSSTDDVPDDKYALTVATKIIQGNKPLLVMVDGGELLEKATVQALRRLVGKIYDRVRNARKPSVRLAIVVASRRQDIWGGVIPKPALGALSLTEFRPHIIREALQELEVAHDRRYSDIEIGKIASDVFQLTAGLPSLVMSVLDWITRTEWADLDSLNKPELFDEIVRPYVTETLFSHKSLFPRGSDFEVERRRAIEQAFEVLCPYRLFTMSHLRRHAGTSEHFSDTLREAHWTEEELWQALSRTALVLQPFHEPWYRIFPAIRQIMFRYFMPDSARQARAHAEARDFYELWRKDKSAGSEQGSIFVESVWHEAVRLQIDEPGEFSTQLAHYTRSRVETLSTSMFEDLEMRQLAARIFEDDEDLQDSLAVVAGLSDMIGAIISTSSPGGNN